MNSGLKECKYRQEKSEKVRSDVGEDAYYEYILMFCYA